LVLLVRLGRDAGLHHNQYLDKQRNQLSKR
jgi:hypothetical protein